jgi:hypothetical protein
VGSSFLRYPNPTSQIPSLKKFFQPPEEQHTFGGQINYSAAMTACTIIDTILVAAIQHYFASFFSDFATAGTAPYKGGARLVAEIPVRGSCPKGLSRKLGRFDIHASTEESKTHGAIDAARLKSAGEAMRCVQKSLHGARILRD